MMNNDTNSIKVGDILVSTWGYDACIADFYKVTARKNKSLYIAPLARNDKGDWVAGTSVPATPNVEVGGSIRRLIKTTPYGEYVKINSYANARKWDGNPISTYNHH